MAGTLKWMGHASFRLCSDEGVVYIDPWKLTDAPHDADVVFVSHDHYDHCSPEDVQKVSQADTTLVAPADAIAKLGASKAITPGEGWTLRDITIEAVAAYNVGKQFHPKGNHWCGAVITLHKNRIYYAGDTDLIPEMSDLRDVDIALLPVGGTYTLDAAQAARACKAIDCGLAIPYHWGDIVGSRQDADAFAQQAPCPVRVLEPGEQIELPAG
jgi:L-ascorbate metabolism protein UlaG (beta-lactamase superfamily)